MASETLTSSTVITNFKSSGTYTGITESPVSPGVVTTDVVYQDIKLYIEGVQVPFVAISVTQTAGRLPTATIEVPPHPGLMDIGRYYEPKVHIFYYDNNLTGHRLLFWGHISSVAYQKSKQGPGSSSIQFNCTHKNSVAHKVLLEFRGYAETLATNVNPDEGPGLKVNNFTSTRSIVEALKGITGIATEEKDKMSPLNPDVSGADTSKLDKSLADFEKRLIGMPACVINLWNQMKRDCFRTEFTNLIMTTMYIPLLEEGLGYFKRMSGHFVLESQIQNSKDEYCGGEKPKVMIPPSVRMPAMAASQAQLAVEAIASNIGFSGELTSFAKLLEEFFYSVHYEIITLASPAEVPVDPEVIVSIDNDRSPKMAVETIIKPQTPFYFSPICNVIFPGMFSDINISQDDDTVPSNVVAYHDQMPASQTGMKVNFRGPHSVREANALGGSLVKTGTMSSSVDLVSTTGMYYMIPGKYELGHGVVPMKITLPWWLVSFMSNQSTANGNLSAWPESGTPEHKNLLLLSASWKQRYGLDESGQESAYWKRLNPYSQESNTAPHYSIMFTSVDYEFTRSVSTSRKGMVQCIFNPYIVPGYPMEVINNSPNDPSFHALCSSVTHSITAQSISTTVGMVGVTTYSELTNYYIPPLHPWLQTALNIVNADEVVVNSEYNDISGVKNVRNGLLQNIQAKEVADQFYLSTLGVGAVAPDDLYDFGLNRPYPQQRIGRLLSPVIIPPQAAKSANGGELYDFLSSAGNLNLVARPIESINSIEVKFNYKFIDLTPENYSLGTIGYSNPSLGASQQAEPGASIFLKYPDIDNYVNAARGVIQEKYNPTTVTSTPTGDEGE